MRSSVLLGVFAVVAIATSMPSTGSLRLGPSDEGVVERSQNGCPPGTRLDKKTGVCKK